MIRATLFVLLLAACHPKLHAAELPRISTWTVLQSCTAMAAGDMSSGVLGFTYAECDRLTPGILSQVVGDGLPCAELIAWDYEIAYHADITNVACRVPGFDRPQRYTSENGRPFRLAGT
jgi:hypothetical protein